MTKWITQNLTLYSTSDSRQAGNLSILAIAEVIASMSVYWWIAAIWQTQLHIVFSLIAVPIYLLRSDQSVLKAQQMYDSHFNSNKEINIYSIHFWLLVLVTLIVTSGFTYWLYVDWLSSYQGWSFFWRSVVFSWLLLNVPLSVISVFAGGWGHTFSFKLAIRLVWPRGVLNERGFIGLRGDTGARARVVEGVLALLLAPSFTGIWLRSQWIRIISVLSTLRYGLKSVSENWRRTLLVEDLAMQPELVPGIVDNHMLGFDSHVKDLTSKNFGLFASSLITVPLFLLPPLLWRLSLKSTFWFYAPIFLMSRLGDLAKPENRLRFLTRETPIWTTWKFYFAIISLGAALISTVDKLVAADLWLSLSNEVPFSPIGWFLVLDWQRFYSQPWQWFSLPAAFLTVFMYLWVDQIRKNRAADIELGLNPDKYASHIEHPGITLYWLDRFRNGLVIISLIVGLWYFVSWAYMENKLTPINPWLSSIFGPLQ